MVASLSVGAERPEKGRATVSEVDEKSIETTAAGMNRDSLNAPKEQTLIWEGEVECGVFSRTRPGCNFVMDDPLQIAHRRQIRPLDMDPTSPLTTPILSKGHHRPPISAG